MSLAVIPSTIVAMLTASLLGRGKSRTVFTAGLIYLASLITGSIIMGRIMGALGLALTLVIAQAIQAIYLSKDQYLNRERGLNMRTLAQKHKFLLLAFTIPLAVQNLHHSRATKTSEPKKQTLYMKRLKAQTA